MFCFAWRQGLAIAQAGLKLEVTLLFLVSKVMKLQTGHHCAKLRSDFFFEHFLFKGLGFQGIPSGIPVSSVQCLEWDSESFGGPVAQRVKLE